MNAQLHTTSAESLSKEILPIKNDDYRSDKPDTGGLWTSTYLGPEEGSEWLQFAVNECGWMHDTKGFILYPRKDINVFIATPNNINFIYEKFARTDLDDFYKSKFMGRVSIDWEKLSNHYDAFCMPRYTISALKNKNYDYTFSCWDVDSTLWFRWCFEDKIEKFEYNEKP